MSGKGATWQDSRGSCARSDCLAASISGSRPCPSPFRASSPPKISPAGASWSSRTCQGGGALEGGRSCEHPRSRGRGVLLNLWGLREGFVGKRWTQDYETGVILSPAAIEQPLLSPRNIRFLFLREINYSPQPASSHLSAPRSPPSEVLVLAHSASPAFPNLGLFRSFFAQPLSLSYWKILFVLFPCPGQGAGGPAHAGWTPSCLAPGCAASYSLRESPRATRTLAGFLPAPQ